MQEIRFSESRFFKFCLVVLIFSIAFNGFAAEFDKENERLGVLSLSMMMRSPTLIVENMEDATPEQKKIVESFRVSLWPFFQRSELLNSKAEALSVGLDRGLYINQYEKLMWESQIRKFNAEYSKIINSKVFNANLQTFAATSESLPGELSEGVRHLLEGQFHETVSYDVMEAASEIKRFEQEVSAIAHQSAYSSRIGKGRAEVAAIHGQFERGEISLSQAQSMANRADQQGGILYANDLVERAGSQFEEIASLRSKMAQGLGFANWAEYALSQQTEYHGRSLETVDGRIEFLEQILRLTDEGYQDVLMRLQREMGISARAQLDWATYQLIHPRAEKLLTPYFPQENIEAVFFRFLRDSGVSQDQIDQLNFDSYPRAGKYNHDSVKTVRLTGANTYVLDASTLSFVFPEVSDTRDWSKIFINHNIHSDGIEPVKNIFHELGHGLDFLFSGPTFFNNRSTSYNETMAMTFESIVNDPEFIRTYGERRDGERVPESLLEKYDFDVRANRIMRFRYQVGLALFDLRLWNQFYELDEKGDANFLKQARHLYEEVLERATYAKVSQHYNRGFASFITDHFYDGSLEYIGYIEAMMASEIARTYVLDRLVETTGKRSMVGQPGLLAVLKDSFYREGHKRPFPQSIEKVTGKDFVPESFAKQMLGQYSKVKRSKVVRCSSLF